jgi:hypothetical protein
MLEKKDRLAVAFRCAAPLTAALLLPVFLFLAACGGGSGGGGTPPPLIASVVISPSGANIAVGQTAQLNATAKDASGNVVSGVSFSWNSDNSLVATVRSDGTANGTGAGMAHISASAGGVSGSSTLNVSGASSAIGSSFFGMTSLTPDDYPAVTVGALGHPPTFAWGWIEQSKGVYTWKGFDTYVEQAESHGLMDENHTVNMIVTFGSTPGWAAADPSTCRVVNGVTLCASPPANIQDWTNFITAVVNHYNGVIEPHIKYYELWNEANRSNFWSGSPADMVTLAQAAYPIIHSDSNSLLLTPSVTGPIATGVSTTASVFMSQYLDAGGSKFADAGTFHGYVAETGVTPYPMPEQDSTSGCTASSNCYGSVVSRTNAMRSLLDAHGLAGKPMYDTEGSWGDGNVTDPDTQTAWLARWYLLQASLASADDLHSVHWYSWGNGTWGNIETTSRQPTAAGIAYNQVFQWLVGATFSTSCSSDSNSTWTCGLTRSGGYQAQAVWNTNGTATYNPPSQFTQYRDLQGNVSHIIGPVIIGIKPILLETGNIP